MDANVPGKCQRAGCANSIPTALASLQLCLDHFVDEAFVRTDLALGRCREGRTIDPDREYTLATTDFTAANQASTDQLNVTGLAFPKTTAMQRDMVIEWIKKKKILD